MRVWLVGFLVGAGLGLVSGFHEAWLFYLVYGAALLVPFALLVLPRSLVLACLGVGWGYVHNPPHSGAVSDARVFVAGRTFGERSVLLVQTPAGLRQGRGTAQGGDRGSIRCFRQRRCVFRPLVKTMALVDRWQRSARQTAADYLDSHLSPAASQWFAAFTLGDRGGLHADVLEAIRNFSLVHLLVVSGLHVSMLARTLMFVVMLPVTMLYALRIVSPHVFVRSQIIAVGICVLICLIYSVIVGFSPPVQRAFLLFMMSSLLPLIFGGSFGMRVVPLAATLQTLMFPHGLLCISALLSWTIYLQFLQFGVVVRQLQGGFVPICLGGLRAALQVQWAATVYIAAIIGVLSPVGVLINLCGLVLFPTVVLSAFAALVLPPSTWLGLVLWDVHVSMSRLLMYLADAFADHPWLVSWELYGFARYVFVVIAVLFLFRTVENLSIED